MKKPLYLATALATLKPLLKMRLLQIVAIIVLLFLAQTATLLHASVHPFHEHTAECDIFLSMENHSADKPVFFSPPDTNFAFVFSAGNLSLAILVANQIFFNPRAPPSFF